MFQTGRRRKTTQRRLLLLMMRRANHPWALWGCVHGGGGHGRTESDDSWACAGGWRMMRGRAPTNERGRALCVAVGRSPKPQGGRQHQQGFKRLRERTRGQRQCGARQRSPHGTRPGMDPRNVSHQLSHGAGSTHHSMSNLPMASARRETDADLRYGPPLVEGGSLSVGSALLWWLMPRSGIDSWGRCTGGFWELSGAAC